MVAIDAAKVLEVQRTRPHRFPGPIHQALKVVPGSVHPDGFAARFAHLTMIVSESKEADGRWWRHASCSRRDRQLPTYDDLCKLHKYCIGLNRKAIQVFAPANEHVDVVGNRSGKERPLEVLHLWACMDGDVLPDFTAGTGSI